jgi:anti-sigma factor RsiW
MMQHLSTDTIVDYLHGGLPPQEDAAVHAHLDGCTACRAEYDAEAALTDLLRNYAANEERPLPPTLKAEIWSRVRASRPSLLSQALGWMRPAVAIPIAAAIAIAAYFGTAYLGPRGAPSIQAAYYLQDHAAMNGTMPFDDSSSMAPVDVSRASVAAATYVTVEPASFTADAGQ